MVINQTSKEENIREYLVALSLRLRVFLRKNGLYCHHMNHHTHFIISNHLSITYSFTHFFFIFFFNFKLLKSVFYFKYIFILITNFISHIWGFWGFGVYKNSVMIRIQPPLFPIHPQILDRPLSPF